MLIITNAAELFNSMLVCIFSLFYYNIIIMCMF